MGVQSKASAIQDSFIRGDINVLSCSTTFELGVDVGEVQAVLLRNVPPSPANYIQRAGRAGRRTNAAALVVTFAQRRSHDLTYFDRPSRMVDGMIPPPRIVLDNVTDRPAARALASRSQRSSESSAITQTVEDFFLVDSDGSRADRRFVAVAARAAATVGDALKRVVPPELHDALGLPEWTWVEALVKPSDDDPTQGWLGRAGNEVRQDVERPAGDDRRSRRGGAIHARRASSTRVRKSITHRRLLGFLASRNVLPKYGFPVDVVELNLARTGDDHRRQPRAIARSQAGDRGLRPRRRHRRRQEAVASEGLVLRSRPRWPSTAGRSATPATRSDTGSKMSRRTCRSCGSEATTEAGRFVIPVYGFAGEAAQDGPGETRPRRCDACARSCSDRRTRRRSNPSQARRDADAALALQPPGPHHGHQPGPGRRRLQDLRVVRLRRADRWQRPPRQNTTAARPAGTCRAEAPCTHSTWATTT